MKACQFESSHLKWSVRSTLQLVVNSSEIWRSALTTTKTTVFSQLEEILHGWFTSFKIWGEMETSHHHLLLKLNHIQATPLEHIPTFLTTKLILCRTDFGLSYCSPASGAPWADGLEVYASGLCFLRKCFFWFCTFFRPLFLLVSCSHVKVAFAKSKTVSGSSGWVM